MKSYLLSAVLLLSCAGLAVAADPPAKPECTAANAGRLWPDEANDNPKFAAALTPYGYPEVCTLKRRVYSWKSLTVSLDQLRRDASKKHPISLKAEGSKKQDQ